MSVLERLGTSGRAPGGVGVSAVCGETVVVLLTSLSGPRSRANRSGFELAAATGSGLTGGSPVDPTLSGVRGRERLR